MVVSKQGIAIDLAFSYGMMVCDACASIEFAVVDEEVKLYTFLRDHAKDRGYKGPVPDFSSPRMVDDFLAWRLVAQPRCLWRSRSLFGSEKNSLPIITCIACLPEGSPLPQASCTFLGLEESSSHGLTIRY